VWRIVCFIASFFFFLFIYDIIGDEYRFSVFLFLIIIIIIIIFVLVVNDL